MRQLIRWRNKAICLGLLLQGSGAVIPPYPSLQLGPGLWGRDINPSPTTPTAQLYEIHLPGA